MVVRNRAVLSTSVNVVAITQPLVVSWKKPFNGGEAGYRYADVGPSRATISSSQDIGIANCPATGCIDHEQLVDLWR